jgi:hypothetical protein
MMADSLTYLICNTCGAQHSTADRTALTTCFICDDPRQFTPPSGQSFTTLGDLRAAGNHRNEFHPFPPTTTTTGNSNSNTKSDNATTNNVRFTTIVTTPQFAIGQRAMLIRTPHGNVLWDCITYLDEETARRIETELGGVQAMVVSHPHFYSAHLEWAERFGCKVYLASEDKRWLARRDEARQVFVEGTEARVEVEGRDTGVRIVKLGGHFPGSCKFMFFFFFFFFLLEGGWLCLGLEDGC